MDSASIERTFASHVEYTLAKDEFSATPRDFYRALALSVRDRLADRWNKTQQKSFREADRRVYYLSLEYLIGRLLEDAMLNLGVTAEARAAMSDLDLDPRRSPSTRTTPGSATAASAGWRPASSIRWRRSASRRVGYGIRYEYGIFRQDDRRRRAGRAPDNWLRYRQPVGDRRAPSGPYLVQLRRPHGAVPATSGRLAYRWVDTAERQRRWPTTRRSPATATTRQHAAPLVAREATEEFDFATLQPRRLRRRRRDKTASENISRVLYPERRGRRRARSCACGSSTSSCRRRCRTDPQPPAAAPARRAPAREVRRPAQRYPPGDRHRRADAPARRRARRSTGTRPGNHRARLRVHQPHAAARGARDAGRSRSSARCCRGICEIIYEINRRFLDEVRAALPGRRRPRCAACRSSTRAAERRVRMAHLAIVGSHARQRRVGAAQPHLLREEPVPRLRRDVARAGSATRPTASRRGAGCGSATRRSAQLIDARIGDGLGRRSRRSSRKLEPLRRRCRDSRAGFARGQARQQGAARELRAARDWAFASTRDALFDVQVKRIHEYKRQLLNDPARRGALPPPRDSAARLACRASFIFARQGGARLRHGQADHPADQRRGRGRSNSDPRVRDRHQRRLPAELLGRRWPSRHPRRRPLRADLDGRHGGLGHRQHEARRSTAR